MNVFLPPFAGLCGPPGEYWRGVRVAEGARLESVYRGNSIAGSNPALSANESKPVRGIFVFTSVECLLSKASGSENDAARSAGFDSFATPTSGIAAGNPGELFSRALKACFQKRVEAKMMRRAAPALIRLQPPPPGSPQATPENCFHER